MGVFTTLILADEELAVRQLHDLAMASGVLDVIKSVTPMPTGYPLARLVGTFRAGGSSRGSSRRRARFRGRR